MSEVTTIYVSQKDGRNSNQGVSPVETGMGTGPVNSIEYALGLVADMRKQGVAYPVTIKVLDEIYSVEKPVEITSKVYNVTLEPATETLISGGLPVTNFQPDEFNGQKCLSADVSAYGDIEFTDFYVNGKRAQITHYPEEGTLSPVAVERDEFILYANSGWFIAAPEDLEVIRKFRNFEDCLISFNHYWVDEHTPIKSYDLETGQITFMYPSRFSISLKSPRSKMNYIIENVAESFKHVNEWYYDRPSKKVYYIPEDFSAPVTAYIPVAKQLFTLTGTAENKLRSICIRDFSMAYTKGDYKCVQKVFKEGNPDVYEEVYYASDIQSVCSGFGNIELRHTKDCTIENCRLFCLGLHAIVAEEGTKGLRVCGNTISQIGAGGIRINGGAYGTEESLHTYGNLIEDNDISHCGLRYYSACGILLMHSYDNVVSHNKISWLYYTGISCGWAWGYVDSISHNNRIEKNHIHHIGQRKLSDMGGIYMLGRQPGSVIRGNLIHHVESKHYGGWALYADEGSSYMLFEDNVCYDVNFNCYHQHYGAQNVVRNNIFAFSGRGLVKTSKPEMHVGALLYGNIYLTDGGPVYQTTNDKEEETSPHTLSARRNFVWDISGKEPVFWKRDDRQYSLAEMQDLFGLDRETAFINPCFANAENRDFTLEADSPVVMQGFRPIEVSDCGPRR